jgi:hypothetical protein
MINLLVNSLNNNNIDNIIILAGTITFVALTFSLYNGYTNYYYLNKVRQEEAVRAQEGLPNDLAFTAEDLRENPELAEMFGVTDVDKGLHLNLQTNAHLEYLENQDAAINIMDYIDVIGDFLSAVYIYAYDVLNFAFFFLF